VEHVSKPTSDQTDGNRRHIDASGASTPVSAGRTQVHLIAVREINASMVRMSDHWKKGPKAPARKGAHRGRGIRSSRLARSAATSGSAHQTAQQLLDAIRWRAIG
jgi:hypothetical protein